MSDNIMVENFRVHAENTEYVRLLYKIPAGLLSVYVLLFLSVRWVFSMLNQLCVLDNILITDR